jgi:hypothetical protein
MKLKLSPPPSAAAPLARRAALSCALALSALVAPNVPAPALSISATTMAGKTRPVHPEGFEPPAFRPRVGHCHLKQ